MKTQIKLLSTIFLTLSTIFSVYSQKAGNLSLSVSQTEPTCNRYSDGEITVNPFNGVAPYTYIWSTGDTTQTISNLLAGNYSVTVTDALLNQTAAFITLTDPMPIIVNGQSTNITSFGLANGTIDIISVENTTGNWTYTWASTSGTGFNQQTLDQTSLIPNNYKIIVTDELGCQGVGYYIITQPNPTLNPINLPKPGKFGNNPSAKSADQDLDSGLDFELFPNPSSGEITIQLANESESHIVITKLDNYQLIIDDVFISQYFVSDLQPGMYLVKVDGITKRLIVK